MVVVNTQSTTLDKVKRRIVKFIRYFKQDVVTAKQVTPFGFDSAPIKNTRGIACMTENVKDMVLLGYLNQNQKAEDGESRLFATDEQGNIVGEIWLRADGTIELAGSSDNVVRYIPLDQAMQSLAAAINTELGKIQAGIIAGGGTYTPGTISIDISQAKVTQLKTP